MGFFLGTDIDERGPSGAPVKIDYAPKHLTTHGLIFGMTGSGKTGLALGLLEEAQRARIPIIAIDPKGDLGNLALAWPDLSPKYFATWIDPSRLDGRSPLDVAEQTADTWREGLAKDGLGEPEIAAMRDAANVAIYTPGSTSGIPVSLLDRFEPPPGYTTLPEEDKSELVSGIVSALLALVKIDADPIQSKEFILLSNILSEAWSRGETLDLPKLVQRISEPPLSRLGVFELDEFFPPKKRRELAMQLNGLIASPSFQAWLQGTPLDVDRLLRKEPPGGLSRTSIFSIAHLDDTERMSFVTLLLDRVIAWMRAQPGTGELRAILYMDEVFGYLPPHPLTPPSKRPLLTLLKQARAFGLGVLIATQNPVDVDYKALTNAGTWMIGKLQTDQDKERILDGLMGAQTATTEVSRSDISRRISALEGRQFLLQNANDSRQRVFKTRFCMSYLRGPLTRQEISRLRDVDFYNAPAVKALSPSVARPEAPPPRPTPPPRAEPGPDVVGEVVEPTLPTTTWTPPPPPPYQPPQAPQAPSRSPQEAVQREVRGLPTRYLPSAVFIRPEVRAALGTSVISAQGPLTLRPALFGDARITYRIDEWGELTTGTVARILWPLPEVPGAAAWRVVDGALRASDLGEQPLESGAPTVLPAWLHSPADRDRVKDLFVRQVIGTQSITVPVCPPLMRYGEPGEPLEDFRARLTRPLGQAVDGALGKAQNEHDQQAAYFKRELTAMKELLEMDHREIKFLRERGDEQGYRRALDRAQLRMERYRELQATRDKFVGLAQRGMADVEFSALDKLEACELRELRLSPKGVTLGFFGLVWVPSR